MVACLDLFVRDLHIVWPDSWGALVVQTAECFIQLRLSYTITERGSASLTGVSACGVARWDALGAQLQGIRTMKKVAKSDSWAECLQWIN